MYVDKSLTVSQFHVNIEFDECLILQILCSMNNSVTTIATVYRSPNSSSDNNSKLLDLINYLNKQVVGKKQISGDFNYPSLNWSNWTATTSSN